MKSRVEAHFEAAHKRPWIIPNGEEVEEENDGKSNPDLNETTSKDANPDDPEPMDDTPIRKDESTKTETEAPGYDSHLEEHGYRVSVFKILFLILCHLSDYRLENH